MHTSIGQFFESWVWLKKKEEKNWPPIKHVRIACRKSHVSPSQFSWLKGMKSHSGAHLLKILANQKEELSNVSYILKLYLSRRWSHYSKMKHMNLYAFHMLHLTVKPTSHWCTIGSEDIKCTWRPLILNGSDFQQVCSIVEFHSFHSYKDSKIVYNIWL